METMKFYLFLFCLTLTVTSNTQPHLDYKVLLPFYSRMFSTPLTTQQQQQEFISKFLSSNELPVSLPFITSDSSIHSFPIINGEDYCDKRYISIVSDSPLISNDNLVDCRFETTMSASSPRSSPNLCICNMKGAASNSLSIALSRPENQKQLTEYLSNRINENHRVLEEGLADQSNSEMKLPTSINASIPAGEKFDIGVVTHAVLVVLSIVSFFGNAFFVIYVFWLSR